MQEPKGPDAAGVHLGSKRRNESRPVVYASDHTQCGANKSKKVLRNIEPAREHHFQTASSIVGAFVQGSMSVPVRLYSPAPAVAKVSQQLHPIKQPAKHHSDYNPTGRTGAPSQEPILTTAQVHVAMLEPGPK